MNLPIELRRQVVALLRERYADALRPGEAFEVEGDLSADLSEVRLILDAPGGTDRVEVAVRVTTKEAGGDAEAALYRALDVGDAVFGEWFEGGRDERWPIDWVDVTHEGRPAHVRLTRSRPIVEAEADRLLSGSADDRDPPDA